MCLRLPLHTCGVRDKDKSGTVVEVKIYRMFNSVAYRINFLYNERNKNKNWGDLKMAISREELHHIINQIPDDKLPSIGDLLTRIYDEELIDREEALEIDIAKERMLNGEYATFEEVFRDIDV